MVDSRSDLDPAEVARFAALAEDWWNPRGRLAPLHAMNTARLAFIREQALARFARDPRARRPFGGLRLVDLGCGGGLVCEPMARLGFHVLGVDPADESVAAAAAHAQAAGLAIEYQTGTVEALAGEGARFDLVLAMEVVEHTPDAAAFLRAAAGLVAPGGLMIAATLNRTIKSLALAKIAAEYVLGWLPRGTHNWSRFVTPDEIRRAFNGSRHAVAGPFGLALDPIGGRWIRSADPDINYFMTIAAAA
jgi:2-polyprenyl-6-hydroxyphenyl methylase/3-demethylubiquinone-9 3-methyltransferase